jgi:hypothetical protein
MASISERTPTPVALLRRWVQDYFNRHDPAAARSFITPDYTLHIGEHVFAGRDESWLPAVDQQMALFPGMGMTVHAVIANEDRAAAWFSEHGASRGRAAVWSGVAIYRSNGTQLCGCVAQEDYFTRQRQLKSGQADRADPPALAPWDTEPLPADPAALVAVREWLSGHWPLPAGGVRCDDEHITGVPLVFEVESMAFTELFSSGDQVAFHACQRGVYRGGLPGVAATGRTSVLHANGLVRVHGGEVVEGRVIRDRMGLRESLQKGAPA